MFQGWVNTVNAVELEHVGNWDYLLRVYCKLNHQTMLEGPELMAYVHDLGSRQLVHRENVRHSTHVT